MCELLITHNFAIKLPITKVVDYLQSLFLLIMYFCNYYNIIGELRTWFYARKLFI